MTRCCVSQCLLGAALAAATACLAAPADSDEALELRAEAAWRERAWAAPRFQPDGLPVDEGRAPWPAEASELLARRLSRHRRKPDASPFNLLPVLEPRPTWWQALPGAGSVVGLPTWPALSQRWIDDLDDAGRAAVAAHVASFSLPAGAPSSLARASADASTTWTAHGQAGLVLAGPAVQEGVTTPRSGPAGVRTRIALPPGAAEQLHAWARRQGLPLQLRLAAPGARQDLAGSDSLSPWIVEAQTDLPAWGVSPEGLQPLRITAFSSEASDLGGRGERDLSCLGTDWLELSWPGAQTGALWAVLLTAGSQPLAAQAQVKRVPVNDALSPPETRRNELSVQWRDGSAQPLRLLARRFGTEAPLWGVQVMAATPARPATGSALLSASGSPACPPP